jgi:hypothetical protein
VIDGASKPDSHGPHVLPARAQTAEQGTECIAELGPDILSVGLAVGTVPNVEPLEGQDTAVALAEAKLELCSADLQAKEKVVGHGG